MWSLKLYKLLKQIVFYDFENKEGKDQASIQSSTTKLYNI